MLCTSDLEVVFVFGTTLQCLISSIIRLAMQDVPRLEALPSGVAWLLKSGLTPEFLS